MSCGLAGTTTAGAHGLPCCSPEWRRIRPPKYAVQGLWSGKDEGDENAGAVKDCSLRLAAASVVATIAALVSSR